MRVKPFTDAVAVDISEFSQWKWTFFFPGGAAARSRGRDESHRVSQLRRVSGGAVHCQRRVRTAGHHALPRFARFPMWMINIGLLLVAAALLLTLWKIYFSLKELEHAQAHVEHAHVGHTARPSWPHMKRVLVATSNEGKIRDLVGAAAAHDIEIATLPNFAALASCDRRRPDLRSQRPQEGRALQPLQRRRVGDCRRLRP